jgi:uncharacterized RDD family membrane protein YckC
MAHDLRPPNVGTWSFNPYAPPSERADGIAEAPTIAPGELRLASPSQRLLAKAIDAALLGLSLAPGIVVQFWWDTDLGVGLWMLGLLAILVVQWALTTTSGQTIGKRWTGLRVVTDKGEPIGFLRGVCLRVWVMWAGSLMASVGGALLFDPLFVFGKQRKTLHDHLAGSLVIVADTPGDPYSR